MRANIMRAVADSCAECTALRWPMQRTAMADAAHCDDRCSTLRQTTLDFRLKTEADQPKLLRTLDKRPKAGGGKKRAFRVSTERMPPRKRLAAGGEKEQFHAEAVNLFQKANKSAGRALFILSLFCPPVLPSRRKNLPLHS